MPQYGQAIDLRQHQIQDDEVVASLPGQLLAYLAVFGAVDGEARAFAQSGGQIVRQPHFIFDDEDTHRVQSPGDHLK